MNTIVKILLIIFSSIVYCTVSVCLFTWVADVVAPAAISYDPPGDLGSSYRITGYKETACIYKEATAHGDSTFIWGGIVDFEDDDRFIIVYQKITESVFQEFGEHYNSRVDSRQLWIIDKEKDKCFGPLTEDQYVLQRDKLKVPADLNFKIYSNSNLRYIK